MLGSFAPRSNKNISESRSDLRISVTDPRITDGSSTDLVVPDVTGELWKKAVETLEMPAQWMEDLQRASGAMLFVRVLSDEIVAPLDWVTAREVLRGGLMLLPTERGRISTQVELCELFRFLELSLKPYPDGSPPRVAIIVTAYDLLDDERAAQGPSRYLEREYPLFAGRLRDAPTLSTRTFGASILGGDLRADEEFRKAFLDGDMSKFGFIVVERNGAIERIPDITRPLAWLVRGDD